MKTVKKLFAVIICLCVAVTCFAGCHKKGEIAVTIGDCEFTSGYYMCALVYADTEARSLVDEKLSAEGESTENVKYYKQKIDGTDYSEYVKDKAMEQLTEIAAYKAKCAEAGISLDEETESNAESMASYYWSYGYSQLFGSNGVSEATFKQYMKDTYYSQLYFEHLYGEGGEREINEEQMKTELSENYVLVDMLESDLSSLEEDEAASVRSQFETYKGVLEKGTADFEEIYDSYNSSGEDTEDEHGHEHSEGNGESAPVDPHASLLGGEDTDNASEYYDDAKDMAVGEVKIVETDDGKLLLIKKLDVTADPYYFENNKDSLRKLAVGDELEDEIKQFGKTLKNNTVKKNVDRFKVKKIVYPENNQA